MKYSIYNIYCIYIYYTFIFGSARRHEKTRRLDRRTKIGAHENCYIGSTFVGFFQLHQILFGWWWLLLSALSILAFFFSFSTYNFISSRVSLAHRYQVGSEVFMRSSSAGVILILSPSDQIAEISNGRRSFPITFWPRKTYLFFFFVFLLLLSSNNHIKRKSPKSRRRRKK